MTESFTVWRCTYCQSIHADDEVDLDAYYAHYPHHGQQLNFFSRCAYRGKLRVLEKLGMTRAHRILDYGCGRGIFVEYLREQGYTHARGYDPYGDESSLRSDPGGGYDFVLSQDVIEHVDSPRAHLVTLAGHAAEGGLLLVGTPDASVVDMDRPASFIHVLHQPYHRHILSRAALAGIADTLGLPIVWTRKGWLGNRALPFLNSRFLMRMMKAQGDVIDPLFAGQKVWKPELMTPAAVWDAFTGYWRDPGYAMNVALRVPS